MTETSDYIHHLPPVLWSDETDSSRLLGRMLRIFEKILTGIPDDVELESKGLPNPSLQTKIQEIPKLFSPYTVPKELLPWLASWVSLDLRNGLDEYQQRKLIADYVTISQKHGTKEGLLSHLDIFKVTRVRPRIVVDACESIFRGEKSENGSMNLHPIAYSTNFTFSGSTITALLHPSAIAVDKFENSYVLADLGDSQQKRQPAIWRIGITNGALEYTKETPVPKPRPIYLRNQAAPLRIDVPVAIVAPQTGASSRYYVLDASEGEGASARTAIYQLDTPNFSPIILAGNTTNPKLNAVMPIDMVQDNSGNLVVLDRGVRVSGDPPLGGTAQPKLIVVTPSPLQTVSHALDNLAENDPNRVIEPTALIIDAQGRFIVADSRSQSSSTPANLILVDPSANWSQTALLSEDNNPLVNPVGLAFEDRNTLLICDTGLRNGFEEETSLRYMAEPPALYRVDLRSSYPIVQRVTTLCPLIFPSKMIIDHHGSVIISDRGEAQRGLQQHNWRLQPHEFGVIVHFAIQRPGANNPEEASRIRRQIRYAISNIVDEQKPAHVSFDLKS